MTPAHARWASFIDQLSRVPICHGTTAHAARILATFPEIDVPASLAALAALGGVCDCEIEYGIGGGSGALQPSGTENLSAR
jgi:hypothetical protein